MDARTPSPEPRCTDCGYTLSGFDAECPRCAANSDSDLFPSNFSPAPRIFLPEAPVTPGWERPEKRKPLFDPPMWVFVVSMFIALTLLIGGGASLLDAVRGK